MAIPNIINIGQSGLAASKAGISTTGHNIANANTEGYSRQRVQTTAEDLNGKWNGTTRGNGTRVARVDRVNDEYVEKQIRSAQRDLSYFEERDLALQQMENIFNETNGDGLNRIISRFFNEFRRLSEEPENPALRQIVREAAGSMAQDFRRLRGEVDEVRHYLDSRIAGYVGEVNTLSTEVAELNKRVREVEGAGITPNDLLDKRDLALKKLSSLLDISVHKDSGSSVNVEIRGVGPLVVGSSCEKLSVERSPADEQGKPEGSFDIRTSANAFGLITHQIKSGKLGAILDSRDRMISGLLSKLDEMAYVLTNAVNQVHQQGVNGLGERGIDFFRKLEGVDRAAEMMALSDSIQESSNNIVTGLLAGSPGDNRVAIEVSRLQNEKLLGGGSVTFDAWYNATVSDVGVATASNRFYLGQQKDIMTHLGKVRDQISGVSIDEETTQLLQFQHVFDASAKVIQVADEMLKTVLALKRD